MENKSILNIKKVRNVKIIQLEDPTSIAKAVAELFYKQVEMKKNASFILATGSSPVEMYQFLIDNHKQHKTDWSSVITFNLDEYIGLDADHPQSYRQFMNNQLFDNINIKKENTFLPLGIGDTKHNVKEYEKLIKQNGPFDICLLGVGANGHIAFNEPGSDFDGITKETPLTKETIETNNKKYFNNINEVPKTAITMGIGTILKNSDKIIMIAFGPGKQEAINHLMKGEEDTSWPITSLLKHSDVEIFTDCKI